MEKLKTWFAANKMMAIIIAAVLVLLMVMKKKKKSSSTKSKSSKMMKMKQTVSNLRARLRMRRMNSGMRRTRMTY